MIKFDKKYTIMFFSADRLGKMRTLTISKTTVIVCSLIIFLLFGALGGSVYSARSLYTERNHLMLFNSQNEAMQEQVAGYAYQIDEINQKLITLDELEFRIRDLIALQKDSPELKPIAVGGKEVDLLREFSATAHLKEKDFFDNLTSTLEVLSLEIEQKKNTLSDLATQLEDQRLVMLYTPTIRPVKGWISSLFGYRTSPFSGRQVFHEGIDIAARYGSDVAATAKGIVVFAGPKAGYGHLVTVDHGYGYITRYGHNSSLIVKVGDKVEKGQILAKVGSSGRSTGPHVHYEVLVNGIPVNPLKFIIDNDQEM